MLRLYWLARNNPFVVAIFIIVFIVISFYFSKFHYGLSENNEVWGSFGDYFGGILNPVIAGFAFYLIRETYVLQKKELEETRSLLKVSTDAQQNQIKLAALTACLNSNLTRISLFESEKISLLQGTLPMLKSPKNQQDYQKQATREILNNRIREAAETSKGKIEARLDEIECEINDLTEKNNKLEKQIKTFL